MPHDCMTAFCCIAAMHCRVLHSDMQACTTMNLSSLSQRGLRDQSHVSVTHAQKRLSFSYSTCCHTFHIATHSNTRSVLHCPLTSKRSLYQSVVTSSNHINDYMTYSEVPCAWFLCFTKTHWIICCHTLQTAHKRVVHTDTLVSLVPGRGFGHPRKHAATPTHPNRLENDGHYRLGGSGAEWGDRMPVDCVYLYLHFSFVTPVATPIRHGGIDTTWYKCWNLVAGHAYTYIRNHRMSSFVTFSRVFTHTHTCLHAYIHTCRLTHILTYAHAHTYIDTNIHYTYAETHTLHVCY